MIRRKMYILIRDTLSNGIAITAAAHAPLVLYLHYKDAPEMQEYIDFSFAKVVCKVNDAEFEQAKGFNVPHVVLTESLLPNVETAIVFFPEKVLPKQFKYYSLWK